MSPPANCLMFMVKLKSPFSKRIPEEVVMEQVQVLSQDAFIDILNITFKITDISPQSISL